MALQIVVEDGTGLPTANSYVDAQFVSDYAESIGSDVWCDNTSKHKVALIQSARFLDMRYGNRFKGQVFNPLQGLLYPRAVGSIYCSNRLGNVPPIPQALKMAQAALAIQYLEQDGELDLNANSQNMLSSESVSVGNGAVSRTQSYFKQREQSAFSVADAYIRQATGGYSAAFVPIVKG